MRREWYRAKVVPKNGMSITYTVQEDNFSTSWTVSRYPGEKIKACVVEAKKRARELLADLQEAAAEGEEE